jgi:hypothetical protein
MRWLKRYNENFGYNEFNQFRDLFKKVQLTPPVDKIHVSKLYKLLIIELDKEVESVDGGFGKFIVIDVPFGVGNYVQYMNIRQDLDVVVQNLEPSVWEDFSSWESFCQKWKVVSLWDYHDINIQEIENMLLEWGVSVENIWAVLA